MTHRARRRAALLVATVIASMLASTPSLADMTKDQCVDANTRGQSLRLDGKLDGAREQFVACSDAHCPPIVRVDCSARLDEIEHAQPTIVLDVVDGTGAALRDVTVSVDGHVLTEILDGTALRVDPGGHTFTLSRKGVPPLTRDLTIHEGEKARRERIVIAPATAEPTPAPAPAPTEPRGAGGDPARRTLGLALGGAGLAGIAVGAVFGVLTSSAASRQKSDCASSTSCADHAQALSDHATATTDGAISTVAFIAGTALLAGGIVLFLTARAPAAPQTAIRVEPHVGPGGATVLLGASF